LKLTNSWNYRPYTELFNMKRGDLPYICRLSHNENSFTADYIDNAAEDEPHTLMWRQRDKGNYTAVPISGSTVTVTGLCKDTDYEFYICRRNNPDERSETRLVRTGFAPGKVINYLHPEDTAYAFSGTALDSPSLVKLPSGRIVVSMGVHKSALYGENLTILYYSDNGGADFHYLCEIFPAEWGKLFYDGGRLYLLAVSRPYGDLLIGCSEDEGVTWSMPTVLLRGSAVSATGGIHRSPNPILKYKGRIIADLQCGTWFKNIFLNAILSAKEGSDLLDVNNWALSEWWDHREHQKIVPTSNGGITGDTKIAKDSIGGIEGNPVVTADGRVLVIHRYGDGKPLVLEYDIDNPTAPIKDAWLVDMPIKDAKAPILYDEISRRHYMLCNYIPDGAEKIGRNVCAIMSSEDLKEWKLLEIILDYRNEDPSKFGVQYFDFDFDGDDIVFISRTACSGAANFHDGNHITFHRIKNFRSL